MEPASPIIHNHVHIPDFTKAPESSLSAAGALQPLGNNGPPSSFASRALTRQYAFYVKLDDKLDEGEDGFDICYLVSADMFDTGFYVEKAKMSEGTAHLFKAFVSKKLGNVVQARERRKEKGKKRARYDNGDENVVPVS